MDTYAGYGGYSSSYYDTAGVMGGILAGLMVFVGVILLIALVVGIISIVGQWKVFKKAGQPGWPALIPIYNVYMLCKISGVNPWWILIVCVSPILGVIPILGPVLVMAVSIYFSILLFVSLAQSFGKDTGWAIGLYFLNPFFMLALGIGKSEYLGPKPMNDIVFNKINHTVNNNQNQNMYENDNQTSNTNNSFINNTETLEDASTSKYCSSCGTKISSFDKFCPNCGKQV